MYLQVNILTLAIFIHMLPFWFNFCTNLQTSVTADRMKNLRTNQEPKGAYRLAWITKKLSFKLPYDLGK